MRSWLRGPLEGGREEGMDTPAGPQVLVLGHVELLWGTLLRRGRPARSFNPAHLLALPSCFHFSARLQAPSQLPTEGLYSSCHLHSTQVSIYSSSFPFCSFPPAPKQTAGVETVKRYSHFSGSTTESSAFVGAQMRSTCVHKGRSANARSQTDESEEDEPLRFEQDRSSSVDPRCRAASGSTRTCLC